MGKQEAFEIFRRDREDRLTIDDNKTVLRHRLAEDTKTWASEKEGGGGVAEPNGWLTPHTVCLYCPSTDTLCTHPLHTRL